MTLFDLLVSLGVKMPKRCYDFQIVGPSIFEDEAEICIYFTMRQGGPTRHLTISMNESGPPTVSKWRTIRPKAVVGKKVKDSW